jgi:hypothetical protein
MDQRILFARIGWMTFYRGAKEERPLAGGSYNKENIGSELFNFAKVDGYLYGYVRAGAHGKAINLKRVDPTQDKEAEVKGLTVVFVSKDPEGGGQRIVGWYKDAVVYAANQPHPLKASYKKRIAYCSKGRVSAACLLPTPWRRQAEQPEVRRGAGGMGEANVCYARDTRGNPTVHPWMKRVLRYIETYDGPNLLNKKDEIIEEADQSEAIQKVIEESAGFETNPKIRKAIEEHAMSRATRHFEKQGFTVRPKGKPYDLHCTKGTETRFVEVKGTRSKGESVALTKNEVEFLGKNAGASSLFILHSVEVKPGKSPKASKGKIRMLEPWDQSKGDLRPISYLFRLKATP